METKNEIRIFARRLLRISHDDKGLLCETRILTIIKTLRREHDSSAILKKYFILVERELHRPTILISSTRDLSTDTVENLKEQSERALAQKFAPKP